MKIKLTARYLIAFLSLLFVINELHSWAHSIVAEWICDCWGTQGFEKWTVCEHCDLAENFLGLAWLAGPAINYIIIVVAWALMDRRNSSEKKSIGFALFFAAAPFARLFAILVNGDEPTGLKEIFSPAANDAIIYITLSVILLLLILPPLTRSLSILREVKGRSLFVGIFALVPFLIINFGVNGAMNGLLARKSLQDTQPGGFPELVVMWGIFWLFALLLTFRNLPKLFSSESRRKRHRRHRKSPMEL
jgi:hypothetical protein